MNTPPFNQRKTGPRHATPAPKLEAWRTRLVLLGLLSLFFVLLGRSVYLQGFKDEFLIDKGEARFTRTLKLEAMRGVITDRNGELLAQTSAVQSIWASPRSIVLLPQGQERPANWQPESENQPVPVSLRELKILAGKLEMPLGELQRKLSETRTSKDGQTSKPDFVWLKRHLSPDLGRDVMRLNIPGIYAQTEYKRFYPTREQLAHVIGFTNIDGKGQEGFELTRESMLAGKPGTRTVIRDRRGYIVEDVSTIVPPQDGQTLQLSIDRSIQNIAARELQLAVERNKAVGGGIVILDAQTGEVLALANSPSYNPNSRSAIDPARRRNRVITDIYEPGSTMKPLTAAAALDAGKVTPSSILETAGGSLTIGPATIRDAHSGGNNMTVEQVIQKSSNVGAGRMALMLERQQFYDFFRSVGFGEAPHTGFPGEASGHVRPWKTWRPIEQVTMSYGHGISVSLIQMARAYQIFASDGQIRPITFTKLIAPLPGRQVIRPETARQVRHMLELVTQPGGTAIRARVLGFRVAGKTGTSHKLENGRYVNKYVASFVGFAPVSNPRLIIAIMIDEPRGSTYYGGTVAAPVFSSVATATLRMLGVPPDSPVNTLILPDSAAPEIKEET